MLQIIWEWINFLEGKKYFLTNLIETARLAYNFAQTRLLQIIYLLLILLKMWLKIQKDKKHKIFNSIPNEKKNFSFQD